MTTDVEVTHDELVQRVGAALLGAAPAGWQRIHLVSRMTVAVRDLALTVYLSDGSTPPVAPPPGVSDLLAELRRRMYEPGRGTWFSVLLVMTPPSEYRISYNMRHDPGWFPTLLPGDFAADQRAFPRDDEHVPDWLHAALEDGRLPTPTEPGSLLNLGAQGEALDEIASLLTLTLPGDWTQAWIEVRAVGGSLESTSSVLCGGYAPSWTLPQAAVDLFLRLRTGMDDGRSWTAAKMHLVHPGRFSVDFEGEPAPSPEPPTAPAAPATPATPSTESATDISANASGNGVGMYYAPLFDGFDADGKPVTDRPLVHRQDVWRIIDYLKSGPVVLAARSYAKDLINPDEGAEIPLSFHTDGTWVWSGQAAHYLQRWGISPPPQLVKHIRANQYWVPEVDDAARSLAVRIATDQAQPDPIPPYVERVVSDEEWQYLDRLARRVEKFGVPADRYGVMDVKPNAMVLETYPDSEEWQVSHWDAEFTPQEWPVVFANLSSAAAYLLGTLLLDEGLDAGAPTSAAGAPVAPPAPEAPAAAAWGPATSQSPPAAQTPPPVAPVQVPPAAPIEAPAVQPPPAPAPPIQAPAFAPIQPPPPMPAPPAPPGAASWSVGAPSIESLPGEPPLSLLDHQESITLPAGVEVDRFGLPNGNLVFELRTPYQNRSLPPDWFGRGYHVYRLQAPLAALTGTATPWFGQPGGGRGFFLPRSMEALIAEGSLVEVPQ